MSRVRSARAGTDEEANDDYILEGEYEKLKRSHRHMQNDYNRYKEDCQRMLKKQNFLLGMLEGEKDAVETDLKNMSQAIVKRRDELNVETLRELCEEHIDSSKELGEEMEKLQGIESNLTDVEKQIAAEHNNMGSYYKKMAEHNYMQMQIGIFENRVQQATVNLDTQLTLNRKLRDEIDHLRHERSLYGDLYKRLSAELQHSKEELTATIGTSTEAFEKRDEAHNKMATLKERREKDMQLHNSEMKELLRIISHDEKCKEFIRIKNNERTEYKLEKAKRVQEEHERRGPAADRILLDTYDTAFNNIYDYTKEEDVNVVIDNYTQKVEENYALYNYANELSSETDELQAEVDNLRESIAEMSATEQQLNEQWGDKMNTVEASTGSRFYTVNMFAL
ncbi:hypothetical protein NP493_594g00019 [Ridgeia piscesae]|uniref:ODAD1 central coiled coil region domain-containing protein n=1 Tax=Ridgeia piscesae TaxID=27915 RepID=A0AAD9NPE7_RIDPI|nr:hypothetical protein NP493_594g00019 [Ridgeia piscesae]